MTHDLFLPSWSEALAPRPLWPHQERAIAAVRQALASGVKRVVLALPTGAGKTVIAAKIIEGALAKGNAVSFTVPMLSLVEQTVEAFEREGICAIGVLQGAHERTDRSQPVQVCSVQTLLRRRFPKSRIVIVDEVHIRSAAVLQWVAEAPETIFIGLSATPWAKGMGKHWQALVIGATIGELIDAGRLSKFRVYAPSHPDLSQVKIVAGEYHEGELSDLMSERKIVADVVETWKKLGPGEKTLCFAVDRAHAAHLQREFSEGGVSCAYVDAFTPPDEREAIKRDFHSGAAHVVVSIGTMIAGIDWDVRCISWARPTKSRIIWVQALGRALRLGDGKEFATILDHADTALTLGLPTEIYVDKLDDGKPKTAEQKALEKKTPLPKACSACGVLKPPRTLICPACGHKPEKQSEIIVEEGELVEFGTMSLERKDKADHATKQAWWSMLKGYALEYGKSDKWVLANYHEKYGVWPRGMDNRPISPSPEVRSWIKSRMIRWAKSSKQRKVA